MRSETLFINMEEIFQILHECSLDNDNCEEVLNITENDSLQDVKRDTEKLLAKARCNIGSVEYANLNKMLAICYLKVLSILSYVLTSLLNSNVEHNLLINL